MTSKIIFHGAEALIVLDKNRIIKERVKKSYRISELDEKIRKLRTRREAKLLEKASKTIPVPKIIKADEKSKEILMEFVKGKRISDSLRDFSEEQQLEIFRKIGENIAKPALTLVRLPMLQLRNWSNKWRPVTWTATAATVCWYMATALLKKRCCHRSQRNLGVCSKYVP